MGCSTSKVSDATCTAGSLQGHSDKLGIVRPEAPQIRIEAATAGGAPAVEDGEVDAEVTTRLLLLGAAESGKTTVLEQIRLLYNHDYTEAELLHRKTFIYENIVGAMLEIITFMNEVNVTLGDPSNTKNIQLIKDELDGTFSRFSDAQLEALKSLWNDEGIQAIYSRRGEFNLNDSIKYFYDNLDRINAVDFKPTPRDIIMTYCPTVGVQNVNFTIKDHTYQYYKRQLQIAQYYFDYSAILKVLLFFRLFDFGGQKSDRRKWSKMYDGITAVIFCIAISEYDQKLNEDGTTNRLHDALELLEQICAEPKFSTTWIIVFLNELDMFQEKFPKVPLQNFMPDYEGSDNFRDAKSYMEKIVSARCSNHPDLLHIEFTCAIDTDEMKKILERTFKLLRHKKCKI